MYSSGYTKIRDTLDGGEREPQAEAFSVKLNQGFNRSGGRSTGLARFCYAMRVVGAVLRSVEL